MIDYDKERENFESMNAPEMFNGIEYKADSDSYQPIEPIKNLSVLENACELNYGWLRWKKRAEIAQAEINKEREQATEYYVDCEQLKAEITDLKQQIKELHASRESLLEYKSKIENPDYVLVPRNPTREMINSVPLIKMSDTFHGELEIFLFDEDIMKIHKAMIEAVEKGDSKHETKLL